MRFIPRGNRVVVSPDREGGIIIPQDSRKGYHTGLIVEVGEGRTFEDGSVVPTGFEVGQRVAYLTADQVELAGLREPTVVLDVQMVLGVYEVGGFVREGVLGPGDLRRG